MPNNAKVTFVGNLTKDPTERTINSNKVTSFTVAVNTLAKKADGSTETNFYEVSVWGKSGDYIKQTFQKGTQVWVTGDLIVTEYMSKETNQPRQALRVNATDVRGMNRLKTDSQSRQAAPTKEKDMDELPF